MPRTSRAAAGAAIATAAAGLALTTMTAASTRPLTAVRPAPAPRVTLVARLAGRTALDASPDPAGKVVYFTSTGSFGPAIFRAPAAGGARRPVLVGAPLRGPSGLAVSNDGRRLFVADTRAGHILVVPLRGGRPHVLAGTAGSAPRGLEIQTRGARELVVFTGSDPRDGRPAVLRISARGASAPTVLLKGAPLRAPDGVAISKTGSIYVTDHGAGGGRALRIAGGHVTTIAGAIRLGHPGGIALTLDESKLLISSLSRAAGTAQVLIVDTASGRTSTFDDVIGRNRHAGGLHRARAAGTMAWADVSRSGKVYRVEP
jgi:DNA-binding beta-propeller fold protein YncE